ncbi:MAG: glycosyltransferase family 2 protein [Thermoanaerobaculia bacterium]
MASRDVSVVVAAFCEEQTIGETVRSLRRLGLEVIVVDDGSDDGTASVARREGATVLTHIVNRGQGAALQTGVRFALARDAAYIVTFDADGQHRAEDVAGILAPLLRGESDVTLGSRFLGPNEVPWIRRVVLKTGIVFTRLVSGIRVTDTHNGLRGFSRQAAATIDIRLDRMAHASEILDQIARSGLRWVEVPVEISYTDYSRTKGQSSLGGLRVVWDFLLGRWLR